MAARQRWARERWPELEPGERPHRPGAARRVAGEPVTDEVTYYEDSAEWFDDTDDGGNRDRHPVVNPYAIVALAAALLLMFPVAVVFGLLAFGHPRGKLMATTAVLLGAAEVAAVVALIVLPGAPISELMSRVENHLAQGTGTAVYEPPATSTPEQNAEVPIPTGTATSEPPADSTTATEQATVAESGVSCPRAGLIGTTAAGTTLLCLSDSSSRTGYRWTGPYRVADDIEETGSPCRGDATTARTVDGRALVCEKTNSGGIWALWTSR
ncbi:hypothetical protein [Nocardia brevicatena]|uniref:hypothetical protein n=1 Tax=Nocardia brevicatena TaxID=37327 RepID=UPI000303BCAA|nr:hypothetical protein [Nocardia brevicatena]